MAPAPTARFIRRASLYGAGVLLGIITGMVTPSTTGCIYHDTCIKVTSPGHDWCRNVALAKQWPMGGSFEDAVPILRPDGATPRGCRCYNDAENQILEIEEPECRVESFVDDLWQAAREECEALVMPGYDHNCWIIAGEQASIVESHFRDGDGACVGNCEYGGGNSCPAPSPYECATGGHDADACESDGAVDSEADESTGDETGGNTTGGALLDVDTFVSCNGQFCEIDEAFARSLYDDPSQLLGQRTRLVYSADIKRHTLSGVEPGSLAYTLGLRDGDRLESIGGLVIYDLDSALEAYVALGRTTKLDVRIQRGTQWLDFTYIFVP